MYNFFFAVEIFRQQCWHRLEPFNTRNVEKLLVYWKESFWNTDDLVYRLNQRISLAVQGLGNYTWLAFSNLFACHHVL